MALRELIQKSCEEEIKWHQSYIDNANAMLAQPSEMPDVEGRS